MKQATGRGKYWAMSDARVRRAVVCWSALLVVSQQGCGGRVIYADETGQGETDVDQGDTSIDTTEQTNSGTDTDTDTDVEEMPDGAEEQDVDCSGDFFEPSVLFEDVGWSPQALSPTRDGLEFFYARLAEDASLDASRERKITVRRRLKLDDAFSDPEPVQELDGACAQVRAGTQLAGLDVSRDALRLYIACNTFKQGDHGLSQLVVAHRADRHSAFVLDPRPIGDVGYSVAISRDELTLFSTSNDPSVDYVLMQTRSHVSEAFGALGPAPGSPTIRNPEPVPGGLMLLGADYSSTKPHAHLVSVERTDQQSDFRAPTVSGLPIQPDGLGDYSPALAGDCRSLYFTRYDFVNRRAVVMQAVR